MEVTFQKHEAVITEEAKKRRNLEKKLRELEKEKEERIRAIEEKAEQRAQKAEAEAAEHRLQAAKLKQDVYRIRAGRSPAPTEKEPTIPDKADEDLCTAPQRDPVQNFPARLGSPLRHVTT